MHNPDVLTQAKLSPGPMGDLYFTSFFVLFKAPAKDFGICLSVTYGIFHAGESWLSDVLEALIY